MQTGSWAPESPPEHHRVHHFLRPRHARMRRDRRSIAGGVRAADDPGAVRISIRYARSTRPRSPQLSSSGPAAIVARAVQVIVNDDPRVLDAGATVADLVATLGLGPRRIAVEVNRAVVPRAVYGATALRDGDTVEIIHFVGGG